MSQLFTPTDTVYYTRIKAHLPLILEVCIFKVQDLLLVERILSLFSRLSQLLSGIFALTSTKSTEQHDLELRFKML